MKRRRGEGNFHRRESMACVIETWSEQWFEVKMVLCAKLGACAILILDRQCPLNRASHLNYAH